MDVFYFAMGLIILQCIVIVVCWGVMLFGRTYNTSSAASCTTYNASDDYSDLMLDAMQENHHTTEVHVDRDIDLNDMFLAKTIDEVFSLK